MGTYPSAGIEAVLHGGSHSALTIHPIDTKIYMVTLWYKGYSSQFLIYGLDFLPPGGSENE